VVLERMEKISWTDRVKSEKYYMQSRKAISYIIKNRKANRAGHTLSWNCLQKQVTEGKTERMIEVTVRRGRRYKQLLDDLREKRQLWKVEQEAKDLRLGRIRNELMNGSINQLHSLFVYINTQRQKTLLKLKDGVYTWAAPQQHQHTDCIYGHHTD
jgi:hypothetical protein